MTSAAIVQLVVALVGGGTIAAVINAIMARKKLGADATKIITEAAAGVTADLRKEVDRLRMRSDRLQQQIDDCERREERWERERREWRDVLALHAAWDHVTIVQARDAGIPLSPTPPLYPPYRVGGVNSP